MLYLFTIFILSLEKPNRTKIINNVVEDINSGRKIQTRKYGFQGSHEFSFFSNSKNKDSPFLPRRQDDDFKYLSNKKGSDYLYFPKKINSTKKSSFETLPSSEFNSKFKSSFDEFEYSFPFFNNNSPKKSYKKVVLAYDSINNKFIPKKKLSSNLCRHMSFGKSHDDDFKKLTY